MPTARSLPSCSQRSASSRWPSFASSGGRFTSTSSGREVEGALDDVDGVGTFVELELQADEARLDEAQAIISQAGRRAGLGPSERRSYLEMLLENIAKLASN